MQACCGAAAARAGAHAGVHPESRPEQTRTSPDPARVAACARRRARCGRRGPVKRIAARSAARADRSLRSAGQGGFRSLPPRGKATRSFGTGPLGSRGRVVARRRARLRVLARRAPHRRAGLVARVGRLRLPRLWELLLGQRHGVRGPDRRPRAVAGPRRHPAGRGAARARAVGRSPGQPSRRDCARADRRAHGRRRRPGRRARGHPRRREDRPRAAPIDRRGGTVGRVLVVRCRRRSPRAQEPSTVAGPVR